MTVTTDQLTAYIDGELSGDEADRVAVAIAADPALSARFDAETQLRSTLRGHFDPIAAEPVPESLTLMMATLAAQDVESEMSDAAAAPSKAPAPARVFDLAAARARRDAATVPKPTASSEKFTLPRWWGTGIAIAASLALGVGFGVQLPREGARADADGALIATGSLARGLEMRLASAQEVAPASDLHILTSFQRSDKSFCRVYEAGATSGIACKGEAGWLLEKTAATGKREAGEYRQAGTAASELMSAAQEMAAGNPLDASQERTARGNGWRPVR